MKKTNQTQQLFLEQLKKTPIVQIACEKLGIARSTFYRWKEEDKEFEKQVNDAVLEGHLMVNDLAESQLIGAVKDRNMNAIMYWLRHHHADYKNKLEIEGTVNMIQVLNPEQQKLVRKALKLAGITDESYEDYKKEREEKQ